MTAAARRGRARSAWGSWRRPGLELAAWVVATAALTAYLLTTSATDGWRLVVGNLALAVALLYGCSRCLLRAWRSDETRRSWVLASVALGLATVGQLLFASSLLTGELPSPSSVTDLVAYLGAVLPLLVALLIFPRPPQRLISRFRSVLDALVITAAVVLVSERTVLRALRGSVDMSSATGWATLAYPVADIALCAVVLTLGMRQPPRWHLTWACMGAGLVTWAVTDSIYVRLLAEGATGLTGGPLVVGWIAAPVLIGIATLVPTERTLRRRDLELAGQLVPYVPVLAAAVVLALQVVRDDPFLLFVGVLLLVAVAVRQVMIVYENLTLTRGLEQKVAERTAELATLGSIVTSSRDAIIGFGLDGAVTAWNPAAESLFGLCASEAIGRGSGFLPEPNRRSVDARLQAARRGEPLEAYEIVWQRPDGSEVPVALTVSPVHEGGVVTGISFSAQDITERRRAAQVLEQAREDALQSARAKSEFLATMSHEIRTPMNGVIGLVSLLLDTDLDAQQRDYVQGVHHAGQALLDVINDILDFSKLEAGKLVLDADDVELRRLAEEVGDLLAPAAYAKGLELIVDVDPATVPVVRGDHVRLRQVLLNLASNAVKFTAEGEVQIRVSSRPSTLQDPADGQAGADGERVVVVVEVVDTGIGVAPEDQDRLFESFAQADASTTRRYGGTGLGLAICRRLVEAMGGTIGVTSEMGAGSTFFFHVPLPVGRPVVGGDAPYAAPAVLPEGLRALVVDDNATNRTIVTAQLSSWGVQVDVAEGAEEALAALRARAGTDPYDLAVLDLLMPDVDGLELGRRVVADPALTGLPMIMLSSAPRPAPEEVASAGVSTWLSKPVRADALRSAVAAAVTGTRPDDVEPVVAAPVRLPAPASRGRVLVVEDNELNQVVARGLVERLGFGADLAANGVEALDALRRQTYDLVLMDCHMPVMDGFAATARIREAERGGTRMPVVALTASATVADRERCLAAGMDDYLAKPIEPGRLADVLERWVPAARTAAPQAVEPDVRSGPHLVDQRGTDVDRIDVEQIEGLAELRTAQGESLLATFIASFARRADDRLATIRTCVARGDDDALVMAAHELKGSAATIGAVRVAALCADLEEAGPAALADRPDLVDVLALELRLALHALDEIGRRAA
ncbi:PAS domain-containing hybrid sensor histidine kinase/response regulator [Microlunatus flavus]|uniref:Circadian input-output histidine kinase CikA n=1 Tax=Microlunatus flavus TaxID=1036181 RepID=A0A1H9M1H7_9ACTN|nr:response regulator [Microlunatus flavus]SER17546.1 PAS domain S-box-containing protein [Microlunatus flavus]